MAIKDDRVGGLLTAAAVQLPGHTPRGGGPYEFGVPGARHVVMRPDQETRQRVMAGELVRGRGP